MEICYTCLSKDRLLFPLCKFREIFKENKMINPNDIMSGKMCWECQLIIEKFSKLKKQVLKAQKLLKTQKFEELKSLSSLAVATSTNFDSEYFYTDFLLNSSPVTTKTEESTVKDDISIQVDKFDFDDDGETIEDIYVESLQNTSEENKIEKAVGDEIMDKFTTVVYSEMEMLRKRDEKRNQPNFKKIPFKCDLCVLGFTKKETYEEHLEKKHDERIGPVKCDICQVRLASEKSLTRHRSQHYISYCCKFCPYVTSQMWAAVSHCRVKHGADTSGRVHCRQCDFVTSTPDELAEHTGTKHRFHCDQCGEKFKGKNTLRTHIIRIHGSNRQFKCEVCHKPCSSADRLATHLSRHGAAFRSRLSHCAPCRKQFASVAVYRNHLRNSKRHANDLHQCPDCDKKFASKVYLTKHRNFYHLRKTKYKCDVCNKLFISNWRLKNHKQKHHGMTRTRDHACTTCGKKFYIQFSSVPPRASLRSFLKKYSFVSFKRIVGTTRSFHAQVKTVQDFDRLCSAKDLYCGKHYEVLCNASYLIYVRTQSTLRGHELTHSEQRSYMCEDCGDTFRQRPALYTHHRLVHRTKTI